MLPGELSISDFHYDLTNEKIAKFPLERRDASKLLIYKNPTISESVFSSLPDELLPDDFLVFNETKVVHARLFFTSHTGAKIEIFCLSPADNADMATSLQQHVAAEWICLVGNARKWKISEVLKIAIPGMPNILEASMMGRVEESFRIKFSWGDEISFAEVLEKTGNLPIPPYLGRNADSKDATRYQTVFASIEGSVAAPTAGLHFTPATFEALKAKGIETGFLTLHVGAGTFKPVKAKTMSGHDMHSEEITISLEMLKRLATATGRIIPVGTTSLRTLESIYWTGVKLMKTGGSVTMRVGQWEPYNRQEELPERAKVFSWLAEQMEGHQMKYLSGTTQLLISPGYQFMVCNGLITNFHQPESTLLLLVSALIGDWKKVYNYALENDFRFLSYGDSSLLIP